MEVPDYIDTEPEVMDIGDWQEYYQRQNSDGDQAFIHIGRMDKTLDLMDEIADKYGTKPKYDVYIEDIF